jgi:predicted CopG family antitoxin
MQIIINAPDNLPQAIIQQQITELETRLIEQAQRLNKKSNKAAKEQAIMEIAQRCASLPDTVCLDDNLLERLLDDAKNKRLSFSELIRRLLSDQLLQSETSQQSAEEFFNTLKPLESFADIQPEQWVENLRSNSRILK